MLHGSDIAQIYAQNIDGRKRRPVNIALRHWERIAEAASLNPREVKARAEKSITAILKHAPLVLREFSGKSGVSLDTMMAFCDDVCQNVERIRCRMLQDLENRAIGQPEELPEDKV